MSNEHDQPGAPERLGRDASETRRAGLDPRSGAISPQVSEQMTELVHELSGLLDGSMRCLSLAARSFPAEATEASGAQLGAARRQIETVRIALERMAAALTRASGPYHTSLGARVAGPPGTITLHEAATHAADVVRPFAAERRVAIQVMVDEAVESEPAGAVYPVLLNGIRNACEAVTAAGGNGGVRVRIAAGVAGKITIEIDDDGAGPPTDRAGAFERGFTTKDGGAGIGLGICRSVMTDLGGTIELLETGRKGPRPGAMLRAEYPSRNNEGPKLDGTIGEDRVG